MLFLTGRNGQTHVLQLADLQQPLQHLGVLELRIPQDRATGLDRLDDLVRHVAGQRETSGVGVDFHRSSKSLLSSCRHSRRSIDFSMQYCRGSFPQTYESASSRMMILCRPAGRVTFLCANVLILFRTTSIPLCHAFLNQHF
jgi:hypothetical protein